MNWRQRSEAIKDFLQTGLFFVQLKLCYFQHCLDKNKAE
jgi:hypothetical protein